MSNETPRPPHRKRKVTINLDDESYSRAVKKAGALARLRAIIRLMVGLWGSDEWPPSMDFSEGDIADEMKRAQKVPRKKKK